MPGSREKPRSTEQIKHSERPHVIRDLIRGGRRNVGSIQPTEGSLTEIRLQLTSLGQDLAPISANVSTIEQQPAMLERVQRVGKWIALNTFRRVVPYRESLWGTYGFRDVHSIQEEQEQDYKEKPTQGKKERLPVKVVKAVLKFVPENTVYLLEGHPINKLVHLAERLDQRKTQEKLKRTLKQAYDQVFDNTPKWVEEKPLAKDTSREKSRFRIQLGFVTSSYFMPPFLLAPSPFRLGIPTSLPETISKSVGKYLAPILSKLPKNIHLPTIPIPTMPDLSFLAPIAAIYKAAPSVWPLSMYVALVPNIWNTIRAAVVDKNLVKTIGYATVTALDFFGLGFIFNTVMCEIFSRRNKLIEKDGRLRIIQKELETGEHESTINNAREVRSAAKRKYSRIDLQNASAGTYPMEIALDTRIDQLNEFLDKTRTRHNQVVTEIVVEKKKKRLQKGLHYWRNRFRLEGQKGNLEHDLRSLREKLELATLLRTMDQQFA